MSKLKNLFAHPLNLIAVFLVFIALIGLAGIISYYYPREVVYVTQPVLLTNPGEPGQKTYRPGEVIEGFFETENLIDATANYKRDIVCGEGVTRLVYSFGTVENFPVKKTPKEYRVSIIGVLPDNIEANRCFIEITGIYNVDVFPLITRNYTYTIRTNSFNIGE